MSKTHIFQHGPSLCITLQFEESVFKRAQLELSKQFKAKWEGEADESTLGKLLEFLELYSKGKHAKLPFPLQDLTPFRQKVLKHLQEVPFGSVVSYGELALSSGHPKAARAVGSACHHNPFPLFIPCHRVIAGSGKIGGFASDLQIKKTLLSFEQ
jgi:methylated-DNA-[protein]-cysteine S-methyltransferase